MYFTDRGIEELESRRGDEQVSLAWLAERLRDFVDANPDFETAIDRLASWLARLDDEEDLLSRVRSARTFELSWWILALWLKGGSIVRPINHEAPIHRANIRQKGRNGQHPDGGCAMRNCSAPWRVARPISNSILAARGGDGPGRGSARSPIGRPEA
jgi:hypothetical protein